MQRGLAVPAQSGVTAPPQPSSRWRAAAKLSSANCIQRPMALPYKRETRAEPSALVRQFVRGGPCRSRQSL
jgi:hypothetical protein